MSRSPSQYDRIAFVASKTPEATEALASDPKHTRTLQYYGMWYLEQGNQLMALDHLERIQVVCGKGCEDYRLLREAIVESKSSY